MRKFDEAAEPRKRPVQRARQPWRSVVFPRERRTGPLIRPIEEPNSRKAEQRGYRRLSLETGSQPEFAPARALYRRYGFDVCGPFASYGEDPFSTFMTRTLAGAHNRIER